MMTMLRFGTKERRPCCTAAKVQSAILLLALLAGILAPGAMAVVQSGIAEVNGTKLYYEMAGSGRVIVLLHGGAVDRRAWDDQKTVANPRRHAYRCGRQRCSRCTRQLRQLGQRNPQSKEGCVSKRGTPGQHRHAEGVQSNGARVFEQAVITV